MEQVPHSTGVKRWLWASLGWTFFGTGVVGAFLPVIPTTPFMLLALWAFSKSSSRLHDYLWNHPKYGPLVRAWHKYGAIPIRTKIFAVSVMALSAAFLIFLSGAPWWVIGLALAVMLYGAGFILTRPTMKPHLHHE
jgi:uncharacterized membrane protein YbaN (DUF454 family)